MRKRVSTESVLSKNLQIKLKYFH